jgi:hypothetical protein
VVVQADLADLVKVVVEVALEDIESPQVQQQVVFQSHQEVRLQLQLYLYVLKDIQLL